ncbi:MAG: hypothetical protein AAFN74_22265, partial [Myxococcota bacterium]
RSAADVERLMQALADARSQVAQRDESLRVIGQRLPRLKRAFAEKLANMPDANSTTIDRPSDTALPLPLAEPVDEPRESELQSALESVQSALHQSEHLELEAQQRIHELERANQEREQQIEALSAQLASTRSTERVIGADYREAELRIALLSERLNEANARHADEVRQFENRIAALTERIGDAGSMEQRFQSDVLRLQTERDELAAVLTEAQRTMVEQRDAVQQLRQDREVGRIELQERDRQVETLQRRAADLEQSLAEATGVQRATKADQRAVELAATHMAQEVESLRERMQSLRNERDALAAASQLLLVERDALEEQNKQDELQAVLGEVTAKASADAAALAAAEERCVSLEASAADALDQLGRALHEKAAAEAQAIAAQRGAQTARARSANLQATVAELHRRLQEQSKAPPVKEGATTADIADYNARIDALQTSVNQAEQGRNELEKALGRTLEEAAVLSTRLKETTEELDDARTNLERSERDRARAVTAVAEVRAELADAVDERNGMRKAADGLKTQILGLQSEVPRDGVEAGLRQQVARLQAERLEARQSSREAELRAQQLSYRVRELQEELRAKPEVSSVAVIAPAAGFIVRHDAQQAEDEVEFLRTVVADRDEQLRAARTEATRLRGALLTAEQDHERATANIAEHVAKWQLLQRQGHEAEAQAEDMRRRLGEHEQAIAEKDEVQARMTDQVERLQRAVIALEGVAEARTTELADARRELQEAEQALAEAKNAAEDTRQSTEALQARLGHLESTVEVVREERDRAQAELARSAEALSEAQSRIAALEDQLAVQARSARDIDALAAEMKASEEQRAALTRRLEQSQADLNAVQAQAKAAEDRASAASRQSAQAQRDVAQGRAELVALRAERDDLDEMLAGIRTSLTDTKSQLAVLGPVSREKGAALEQAEARLRVAHAVADGADAQLSELVTSLEKAQSDLTTADAHIGRLEDEAARLRSESAKLSTRVGQLERSMATTADAQEAADRARSEAESREAQVRQSLEQLRDSNDEATIELKMQRAKHDAVRQALEEARDAVDSLRSERDSLEIERDALLAEVGTLTEGAETQGAALAEVRGQLAFLQGAHEDLARQLHRSELPHAVGEHADEIDDLQDRLAQARIDMQAAKVKAAEQTDRVAAMQAELEETRRSRDELATALDEAAAVQNAQGEKPDGRVVALTGQVAQLRAERESLSNERQRLQTRVSDGESHRVHLERRIADLENQI